MLLRKVELLGLIITTLVLMLLMLTINQQQKQLAETDYYLNSRHYYNSDNFKSSPLSSSEGIETVITHSKFFIEQELDDYRFPVNKTYENLSPVEGGTPFRSVILSTWRSGSTFLGEILNTIPGNFYHYEPLLDYGIVQIRGPPLEDKAVKALENLLKCNYDGMDSYLKYGQDHKYLFTHNTRLWTTCEIFPNYCWNATFLTRFCRLFPFQSMKVVRLRLKIAERLLKKKDLNVRVLLLVRDPRGVLQSRKHREWCPGIPDCDQPNLLCADMVSDYSAAIRLRKKYPNRFKVVRYEDLSTNPYHHVQSILKFFNRYYHPNVNNFLDTHTKINFGGLSSTFRNSKDAPFHWRSELNFTEVQFIEEQCSQAMHLWGYKKAYNETNLKEFNPIQRYTLMNER